MAMKEDAAERKDDVHQRLLELKKPGAKTKDAIQLYDEWKNYYDEDLKAWGYCLDKHLDEFGDFVRISKDSRILDVAAGGYIFFLAAVEFLREESLAFEEQMRKLQAEGIWRWVLMKESPDKYYEDTQTLIYAFKVLK